ncbi:MAG: hypothetical protein ACU84H_14200 [Gammaproteobacteria bacterium]
MVKHRILFLTAALLAAPFVRGSGLIFHHGETSVGSLSASASAGAVGLSPCRSRVCGAYWLRSADGTLYRAATPIEIENNKWPRGTYLVLDYIKKSISADVTVEELVEKLGGKLPLSIPRADNGSVEKMEFKLAARKNLSMSEFPFNRKSPPEIIRRTFYRLTPVASALDRKKGGADARLSVDSKGNYTALVSFKEPKRTFTVQLLGPEKTYKIEKIPAPDGTAPGAADVMVVWPSQSTGGSLDDLALPPSSNPVQLALFGNIMWCQKFLNNWPVLIFDTHHEVILGFRSSSEDTGVDIVVDDTAWCMVFDPDPTDPVAAMDEAKWCEWGQRVNGDQCVAQPPCLDSQGRQYPFTGDYRNDTKYLNDIWDKGVEYADHYLSLPPVWLAQVLVQGGLIHDGDAPCPDDNGNVTLCGSARTADPGGSVSFGRPSANYDPISDGCGYTSAHELGHTLIQFAGHEKLQNDMGDQNCGGYETIMFGSDANGGPPPPDACRVNWFSSANADAIKGCVADNTNSCPRSGPYTDQFPPP